jgi:catechol 2,3-dioxygenase-like lactoylglutathione lyase family enzyme
MKTHISISATDLPKSVGFYSVLLNAKPKKSLNDYALFITKDPGLELAIGSAQSAAPAVDAHYGICVESVKDVKRATKRLDKAGLVASIEREETCCYANQTKVWTIDPDGRRWEIYTVHEDTEKT